MALLSGGRPTFDDDVGGLTSSDGAHRQLVWVCEVRQHVEARIVLSLDCSLDVRQRALQLALVPRHWHRERVTRRKHESLSGDSIDPGASVVCAHARSSHRIRQRRG